MTIDGLTPLRAWLAAWQARVRAVGFAGDRAWIAAPWTSRGTRADGTTFPRPGRCTIAFERRDGRWLAVHTHFSLTPQP